IIVPGREAVLHPLTAIAARRTPSEPGAHFHCTAFTPPDLPPCARHVKPQLRRYLVNPALDLALARDFVSVRGKRLRAASRAGLRARETGGPGTIRATPVLAAP